MKLLGIALFFPLTQLVAPISLSVPTADVVQFTSVNCQWTTNPTDPAAFALVMQFSNASSLFGELADVTTVQRGTNTSGTVPNIPNVVNLGMHRLAAYANPFDANSQPLALSPAFDVVASSIALSVPTTDVAVGTSVNCQWTSNATDPATFTLVMQFSNPGSPQFGDLAVVTVVRRGTTTSGTVPNIKNVAVLGMHRLAAYPDPFDSGSPGQPFSVSPAFNVIANSSQSSSVVGPPTSILPTTGSTSTPNGTSSSRSSNHKKVIIAVVVVCVVLALAILGGLLLLRRRRRKNAETRRPRSLLAEDLGPSDAATMTTLPSETATFSTSPVSPRHDKMVERLVPQRSVRDRRPDESNLSAASGSTYSDPAVTQRLQRTEAEVQALRAELRTLTQPPPSYFAE